MEIQDRQIHRSIYRTIPLSGVIVLVVVLAGLVPEDRVQYTLFDDPAKIEKMAKIYHSIDELSARFGKHTVQHAASLPAALQAQHEGDRGDRAERKTSLFRGENKRQRLGLPMLNVKV